MAQSDELSMGIRLSRVEEVLRLRCGVVKEIVLTIRLDRDEVFGQTYVVDFERLVERFERLDERFEVLDYDQGTFVDSHYVWHVAAFGFGDFGAAAEDNIPARAAAECRLVVQDSNLMAWRNKG